MTDEFCIPYGTGKPYSKSHVAKSRSNGGRFSGRMLFKLDGKSYTLAECMERTGLTAEAFREKYRYMVKKNRLSWEEFK